MANAVWGLFSRDPLKDFSYEVTSEVLAHEPWILSGAKKKNTNEELSAFVYRESSDLSSAREVAKRLKTLRHPNLLTFVDSLETDKLVYIITEAVTPLQVYLESVQDRQELLSWGLFQLTNALRFLSEDCKLCHNNVSLHSVFVNASGEWKLGGFDYVTAQDVPVPSKPYSLRNYEPPETKDGGGANRRKPWSYDMYGLGCTIWEIFNRTSLSAPSQLRTPKKIPSILHKPYASLISSNPMQRCSPAKFIELCRAQNGFMRNNFVNSLIFLEEIQIKDAREKSHFFNQLHESLDQFPEDIGKNKILPLLVNAYEYGDAGSAVLPPLFKLGRLLNSEEYQKKVVPCVIKLFSSTDRSTRFKLLEQIELYVSHLQPAVVDKIFPQVITGFMDTNPAVREATVKAMIHIAPKLNYNNLNVELMKHLARLQSKDEQPGIRTNTTIALGKVAGSLHHQNRQKILVSAFTRAFRDPFPPARSAGIVALSATQQFYSLDEVAQKVLPALTPLLVDPEKTVRDAAFKATKGFIDKLHRVSENPELKTEMESQVNAASSAESSGSSVVPAWAGWAMGAIGSKFYKSSNPAPVPVGPSGDQAKETTPPSEPFELVPSRPAQRAANERSISDDVVLEPPTDVDGWGELDEDDWGSMDEPSSSAPKAPAKVEAVTAGWDDDDDADWGSLEEETEPEPPVDPAPIEKKTSIQSKPDQSTMLDEWGDPDDDDWLNEAVGKKPLKTASLNDRNARKRQEMAQRRQAGPMRLGAKRL